MAAASVVLLRVHLKSLTLHPHFLHLRPFLASLSRPPWMHGEAQGNQSEDRGIEERRFKRNETSFSSAASHEAMSLYDDTEQLLQKAAGVFPHHGCLLWFFLFKSSDLKK